VRELKTPLMETSTPAQGRSPKCKSGRRCWRTTSTIVPTPACRAGTEVWDKAATYKIEITKDWEKVLQAVIHRAPRTHVSDFLFEVPQRR
jgi:hypothetical protein